MVNQLVIFDFDNTLVHSRIDYDGMRRAVIELLRQFDVPQANKIRIQDYTIGQLINIGAEFHADFADVAWQKMAKFESDGMAIATVEADAAPTLKVLLERGCKLAIVTNNTTPATRRALEKFELSPYFELVLTRDDVPLKPDPTGILRAKSTFTAKSTFYVGDSWLDGKAANCAKVPFIAFQPRPKTMEEHGVIVWETVQYLREIPELLDELDNEKVLLQGYEKEY